MAQEYGSATVSTTVSEPEPNKAIEAGMQRSGKNLIRLDDQISELWKRLASVIQPQETKVGPELAEVSSPRSELGARIIEHAYRIANAADSLQQLLAYLDL